MGKIDIGELETLLMIHGGESILIREMALIINQLVDETERLDKIIKDVQLDIDYEKGSFW